MTDVVIENQPDASRYALLVDGRLVSVLDYRIQGATVAFPRTFTQPAHRGKGLAERLVDFAIADVEKDPEARVVPSCWYVQEWFDRHPEKQGLLAG